jgi:hypothetical protein
MRIRHVSTAADTGASATTLNTRGVITSATFMAGLLQWGGEQRIRSPPHEYRFDSERVAKEV